MTLRKFQLGRSIVHCTTCMFITFAIVNSLFTNPVLNNFGQEHKFQIINKLLPE